MRDVTYPCHFTTICAPGPFKFFKSTMSTPSASMRNMWLAKLLMLPDGTVNLSQFLPTRTSRRDSKRPNTGGFLPYGSRVSPWISLKLTIPSKDPPGDGGGGVPSRPGRPSYFPTTPRAQSHPAMRRSFTAFTDTTVPADRFPHRFPPLEPNRPEPRPPPGSTPTLSAGRGWKP